MRSPIHLKDGKTTACGKGIAKLILTVVAKNVTCKSCLIFHARRQHHAVWKKRLDRLQAGMPIFVWKPFCSCGKWEGRFRTKAKSEKDFVKHLDSITPSFPKEEKPALPATMVILPKLIVAPPPPPPEPLPPEPDPDPTTGVRPRRKINL